MPTIHIHHDDPADAGDIADIVATLMQWPDMTIHITTSPHLSGGPTMPDQAFDDIAYAEAMADEVNAAIAARAATDPHPLVVTVGEAERQRLMATWEVRCPKCGARPGKACESPSGAGYGASFVHNARRQKRGFDASRHPAVANIAIPLDEM